MPTSAPQVQQTQRQPLLLAEMENSVNSSVAPPRKTTSLESACRLSAFIGNRNKNSYKVDGTFWRRLKFMLSFFDTRMVLMCLAAVPFSIFNGIFGVLSSKWVATELLPPIFQCNLAAFRDGVTKLAVVFVAMAVSSSVGGYLSESVRLRWRVKLTRHFHSQIYGTSKLAYYLTNIQHDVDNIDQRVTNDIELATGLSMNMVLCSVDDSLNPSCGLIELLSLFATSLAPFLNSGWGPAVATICYSLFFLVLSTMFMRKVVQFTFQQQFLEGAFRYVHTRIREFSESIVFYRGVKAESEAAVATFASVVRNRSGLIFWTTVVGAFGTIAGALMGPFGYTVIVWMTDEKLVQMFNSTTNVSRTVSERTINGQPVNPKLILKWDQQIQICIGVFTLIPVLWSKVPNMAGAVHRVGELQDVILAAIKELPTAPNSEHSVKSNTNSISVENLCSRAPGKSTEVPGAFRGKLLFHELSFEVKEGESLIIMGASGTGKTSLLRILGGLWPFDAGKISKPSNIGRGGMFFLPQRPYITLGTLREQLIYPHNPNEQNKPDDQLIELLRMVGLIHLMYFEGGLDAAQNWADMLSGGEQQRIGFCRMFYHEPKFVVMDESTSALDIDLEKKCMEMCLLSNITMISVGHRPSLIQYHKQKLTLQENCGAQMEKISPTPIASSDDEQWEPEEAHAFIDGDFKQKNIIHEKSRNVCSRKVCRHMKHFCGVGFGNVCSDPMFMYVISTTVAIGADVYLSTNILNRLNTNGLVQLSSSEGLVSGTMWSYWIGSIGKALLEIWVSFGILKIALLWRRRVVRNNNSLYFKDTAVYVANNLLPKKDRKLGLIDNIDQRYTTDTDTFTTAFTNSVWGAAGTITLTGQLFNFLIGIGLLLSHGITPYSCALLFGVLVVNQFVVVLSMGPVGRRAYMKQKMEGDFRHLHARGVEFAESICFYHAEENQSSAVDESLGALQDVYQGLIVSKYVMLMITDVLQKISVMTVSPIMYLLNYPCTPTNPPGPDANFQLSILAGLAASVLIIPKIVSIFGIVSGFVRRLGGLDEALKFSTDRKLWEGKRGTTAASPNSVIVENLTCTTPSREQDQDEKVLFRDLSFEVKEGESLIIMGASGTGKTSLLRILGGLWPFDAGKISKPSNIGRGGMFFLPQRPYITLGTLREQLIYPHNPNEQNKPDDQLIELLRMVGLIHLMYFEGGLDAAQNWADMLSGGEQQRIGFCRMFYHEPKFVVMDESTSALDIDLEKKCMEMCLLSNITMISVGHRPSLIQYHKQKLTLNRNASDADTGVQWAIEKIAPGM